MRKSYNFVKMPSLTNIVKAIKYYGPGFLIFRVLYGFKMKSGLMKRRFAIQSWDNLHLSQFTDVKLESFRNANYPSKFFFNSETVIGLNCYGKQDLLSDAEKILDNKLCYFFNEFYYLGEPVNWFVNPVTGSKADSETHWSGISLFDKSVGDIKYIWEPSRFAWAYTLIRAYSATSNDKYVEKFWSIFEQWLNANQPNQGANYSCGQECAIRLMAIAFAFFAFRNHPSCTDQRLERMLIAIGVHAQRILGNIHYAISTETNHSLTEATGIYTAGLLFPQFYEAAKWRKKGKEIFTREAIKQIFEDGSYIQHSMNYHRMMLQGIIWFLRLGQLNGDMFDKTLINRAKSAVEFIYQMHDSDTGRVPNYGANDGALIFPLNNCSYLDYRPVMQCGYFLFNNERLFEDGPWDEDLIWFFGKQSLKSKITKVKLCSSRFDAGGYYTICNKSLWAMIRCHTYKNRPSQADMLHLDLWWKGRNILRDSGTYMYNCKEPWQSYFPSTSAHNTVVIDGKNQMNRLSRFMWSNWTKSKLLSFNSEGIEKTIEAEHYGYLPVIHRRKVSLSDIRCVVTDEIQGEGEREIQIHWHLLPGNWHLKGTEAILKEPGLETTISFESEQADKALNIIDAPESLFYGSKKEVKCLVYQAKTRLPAVFTTAVQFREN